MQGRLSGGKRGEVMSSLLPSGTRSHGLPSIRREHHSDSLQLEVQHGGCTFALMLVTLLTIVGALSPVLAQTDLVKNGYFEEDSDQDGFPDDWRGHNLGPEDRLEMDVDPYFHQVFAISGEPGVNKALRQTIRSNLEAGARVIYEAGSRNEGATRDGGLYAFKVDFVFVDGSKFTVLKLFSPRIQDSWMRRIDSYVLPIDLERIVVSVTFNNQTGKAWFDRVSVWIEPPGQDPGAAH